MNSTISKLPCSAKIGITLGDPAGIGPEITARALAGLSEEERSRIVVFGDEFLLVQQETPSVGDASPSLSKLALATLATRLSQSEVVPGTPNTATARAQVGYLQAALHAARAGEIAGLVTAPISKAQAQSAGFAHPGHTEFLCEGLGAARVAMMFAGPKLKVVLVTVHEALADLPRVLTQERIVDAIVLAARSLDYDFGIVRPRIGVLGLNPHAGEGGRFGDEESRIIRPAIDRASEQLSVSAELIGPLVPDAAFRMNVDCFVAMYHDQGLIPVKLIDFDESVNTTLGLPIVRTSPDHGVAYDIAGKGVARSTSMKAAIALAFRLVDQRETRRATVS